MAIEKRLRALENAILDLANIQNNQIKLLDSIIVLLKVNSDLLLKMTKPVEPEKKEVGSHTFIA